MGVLTVAETTSYPHMLWYLSSFVLGVITLASSMTGHMSQVTLPLFIIAVLFSVALFIPLGSVFFTRTIRFSNAFAQLLVLIVIMPIWYVGMLLPYSFLWLRISYFFFFFAPIFYICRARWREQLLLAQETPPIIEQSSNDLTNDSTEEK